MGTSISNAGSKEGTACAPPRPETLRLGWGPAPSIPLSPQPLLAPVPVSVANPRRTPGLRSPGRIPRLHVAIMHGGWFHAPVADLGASPFPERHAFCTLFSCRFCFSSCFLPRGNSQSLWAQPGPAGGGSLEAAGLHPRGARGTRHPSAPSIPAANEREGSTAWLPPRGRASDAEGNHANPTGCLGPAGVLDVRTVKRSQDASSSPEERRKTVAASHPAPELGFPTPKPEGKQKGFGLVLHRSCHWSIFSAAAEKEK